MVTEKSPQLPAAVDLATSSVGLTAVQDVDGMDFIIVEYQSLRSEILKLIELQTQLISLSVIALGAMLSFALQMGSSELVLIYPLLSLILGISWLNHSHAISRCGAYISREIESRFGDSILGWETYVRRNPFSGATLGYWGVRSIFMGSSAIAVFAGIVLLRGAPIEVALLALSFIIMALTVLIFVVWREPSPRILFVENCRKASQKHID